MTNPKTPRLIPLWILDNDLDVMLLPSAGIARLEGQQFVSLDELVADLLDYLRSNSPASDAMKVYLRRGELSLGEACLRQIPDPQLHAAAHDELRQAEARLLKDYQARMASIQSETDAWRAKGLPGDELLRSKPFLSDAQRYIGARRIGKAIASLDQCIEFALNIDDEMTRWATDFEQLWDTARKLFSSMAYSPAAVSLTDAVEIFDRCRQCYDSDHRHPTQRSVEAMRALVNQLQALIDGKAAPARHSRPDTGSNALPRAAGTIRPQQSLLETTSPAASNDKTTLPERLTTPIFQLETLLEKIESAPEEEIRELRAVFLRQLATAVGIPDNEDPEKALFSSITSERQRRTVAAWLLRLLCHCSSAVEDDRDFRVRTCELFDTHLLLLYKSLQLRVEQPNHEKLLKLRDAEPDLLDKFDALTRTVVSLQTALDIQNRFMQELRRPAHQILLEEFVDSSLQSTERLREIFNAVKEYVDSAPAECVGAYHNVDEVCEAFFRDETAVSTHISRHCLVAPLRAIYSTVKQHFECNDVVKPARVQILDVKRKYPLHMPGRRLDLKFLVTNEGPGHAFDVETEIDPPAELSIGRPAIHLGTLPAGTSTIIFEAEVIRAHRQGNLCVVLQASWNNFGQRRSLDEFIFELEPQRADIDWDTLRNRQPYSLEAVETEEQLVGRGDVIKSLLNRLQAEKIESSIICGQKRVGKTSIARILQQKLQQIEGYFTVFIEIGALNTLTPDKFVNSLGEAILREIDEQDFPVKAPSIVFDGSLAPLIPYMKAFHRSMPGIKFVLIFDEFDKIPPELYRYTPIANTFFQNIRSLSSEGYIGFVLVGGENMLPIQQSTDNLNKFDTVRVDYFDKGKYWNDFQDLVRRPTKGCLEYSDNAVQSLYEFTEGNPFYTKLICRPIYAHACEDRNSYVSQEEVERATVESLDALEAHNVNHFWTDGIRFDDPARRDEIETQRRKFLLGFADARRRSRNAVSRQELNVTEVLKGEPAVGELIDSFVSRGVLIEENGIFRLKPRYFERWLVDRGSQLITSSSSDQRTIDALRKADEEAYVRDGELVGLCKPWGLYRGNRIQSQEVRNWLSQFEGNREQRLMFHLLKGLRFYSEPQIREKMTIIHRRVRSSLVHQASEDERVRKDLLLSSFGKPSKSASSYARMYAQENRVSTQNAADFAEISQHLSSDDRLKGLVFVDDIIASGQTVIECLDRLEQECGDVLARRQIRVFIGSICAFSGGVDAVEQRSRTLAFKVEFAPCDLLTESDQCFSENSKIFTSEADREKAKEVALTYGKKIAKNVPLGYRDGQLLVVFPDNCPNNSLSILWATGTSRSPWTPLFARSH